MANFLDNVRAHAPQITLGSAIACSVAGAGLATWGAFKVMPILEEFDEACNKLEPVLEEDPKGYHKELVRLHAKYYGKIALIFGPAIAAEAAAISLMLVHYKIMNEKVAVVTTALAGLTASTNRLITKFKEKYGEKAWYELEYGDMMEDVIVVNPETKEVESISRQPNEYLSKDFVTYVIRKGHPTIWGKNEDPLIVLGRLRALESTLTQRLIQEKSLTINEALKALHFLPIPTEEGGNTFGWKFDPDDTMNHSNRVEFGLLSDPEIYSEFCKGKIPEIWIRFNIDPIPI